LNKQVDMLSSQLDEAFRYRLSCCLYLIIVDL